MTDLTCDNQTRCQTPSFLARATVHETETAARIHGWRIFHGPLEGGLVVNWTLCPACVGGGRPRIPKAERLDGEQPLF